MFVWFLLSIGAAVSNSATQVIQKWAVVLSNYSKITITFIATITAALILFAISYFITGFPLLQSGFWEAVLITSILNFIAFPVMLKAYELGEFSSVYSMILMTPVFLLFTSFIFLGEIPSMIGAFGVLLTVIGLWVITQGNHEHLQVPSFAKGNLLGLLVAFLWSVSVNFDKLSAVYSDRFFAPAMASAMMAAGYAIYLLIKNRRLFVRNAVASENHHQDRFLFQGVVVLLCLGASMALGSVLHNSALLAGLASYTIAIKRMGVLFGVIWGWLFFKEKDIAKKLLGAAIAVAGVVAILFS